MPNPITSIRAPRPSPEDSILGTLQSKPALKRVSGLTAASPEIISARLPNIREAFVCGL